MKFSWWKFILGFILYLFFHEFYDLADGSVIGWILGEGIGGVYPHMKMLFYAYLVVSIIDYFIQRNKGTLCSSFFYSRMLILAAVPWMMIIIYYAVEAVGVELPRVYDIIWAIINTLLGLYFSIRLEETFDNMPLRGATKGMIVLAFLTAFITYVGFSFHVPENFFFAVE
jgi:hypothetical protein